MIVAAPRMPMPARSHNTRFLFFAGSSGSVSIFWALSPSWILMDLLASIWLFNYFNRSLLRKLETGEPKSVQKVYEEAQAIVEQAVDQQLASEQEPVLEMENPLASIASPLSVAGIENPLASISSPVSDVITGQKVIKRRKRG